MVNPPRSAIRPWPEVQARLPALSKAEQRALRDSIKANGVKVPIYVLPDGRIIDGHHRWEASGGTDNYEAMDISPEEAFDWAIGFNALRRQMSADQLKELRDRLAKDKGTQKKMALALRKQGKTQDEAAAIVGVAPRTVDSWETEDGSKFKNENASLINSTEPLPAPAPDCRLTIPKGQHAKIVARCDAGETQAAVADDYKVTRRRIGQIIATYRRTQSRTAYSDDSRLDLDHAQVTTGDFRSVMADMPSESVDMIFTDPPYNSKSIALYGDLAQLASRVLRRGGNLITYVGHYAIPEVMPLMTPHLRYWWMLAVLHAGNAARMQGKLVYVHWKPMLWFVKECRVGEEYVADLIKSEQPTKALHDWEQSTVEANYYIEKLTEPGAVILDPFCGSGTTLIAAQNLGRRGIGIESDQQRANVARVRLTENHTRLSTA